MAAKHLTVDQCQVLHKTWPDNCCLCRVNAEKAELLARVERLEGVVDAARRVVEAFALKGAVPGYITTEDLSEPLEDLGIAVNALEESDGKGD